MNKKICTLLYFSMTENPYWRDKGNTPTALQTVNNGTRRPIRNYRNNKIFQQKERKEEAMNLLTTVSASHPVPESKSIIRINTKLFHKLH